MSNYTGKELLELAAKAAGLTVTDHEYNDWSGFTYRLSEYQEVIDSFNPLNDDGDALRLAVKLGLEVNISNQFHDVAVYSESTFAEEPHNSDPYAATRRAIVRAAAAIGSKL